MTPDQVRETIRKYQVGNVIGIPPDEGAELIAAYIKERTSVDVVVNPVSCQFNMQLYHIAIGAVIDYYMKDA